MTLGSWKVSSVVGWAGGGRGFYSQDYRNEKDKDRKEASCRSERRTAFDGEIKEKAVGSYEVLSNFPAKNRSVASDRLCGGPLSRLIPVY